ncbi:MAG: DUF86 domain-containing protein [Chloroflexi bacterium]|nr:DUF86 domain-containing protein [Chloroflexota bacterium]
MLAHHLEIHILAAHRRGEGVPPRDWHLRVEDILEAREDRALHGGDRLPAFAADERTVDAVLRNLGIIGEAARYVPPEMQARFPAIPWSKMQAMRNVVVHIYAEVSLLIVWDTIQEDLPPLAPLPRAVLEQT